MNGNKQSRMRRPYAELKEENAHQTKWWNKNFVEDEVFGQARV